MASEPADPAPPSAASASVSPPARPDAATLVAAVAQSPAAVAEHDRGTWLDLFAPGAEVSDPVGSRPNRGREELTAFYETFIAPNDISFHVDHDTVCGATVFRDLTLQTIMGGRAADGGRDIALFVPMHLRYDVVPADEDAEGGHGAAALAGLGPAELRLGLLHAHWELPSMIGQLMAYGPAGARIGAGLVPRLLRNQRLAGSIGYGKALRRTGRRGKATVGALLTALAAGAADVADTRLAPDAKIELPGEGIALSARRFCRYVTDVRWRKATSAGMTVTATIEIDAVRGVGLFEFDGRRDRVSRVRLFLPN